MLVWVLILGTLLGFPVVKSDRGEACGSAEEGKKIHQDADGNNEYCCNEKKCNKGYVGIACNDTHDSKCIICPKGSFREHGSFTSDGFTCKKKEICDPRAGKRVFSEGSEYENRQCVCDNSLGYFSVNNDYCKKKVCPAGEQLTEKGDCVSCPLGKYKETNMTHVCVDKRDCEKEGLAHADDHYATSKTEDSRCVNRTVDALPNPEKEVTTIHSTMSTDEQFTTAVSFYDSSRSMLNVVTIVISLVLIICAIFPIVLIKVCWNRRKKHRRAEYPLKVELKQEFEEPTSPMIRLADEHDENTPLQTVSFLSKRGPSETDERDFFHKANNSAEAGVDTSKQDHKFQRQCTIDSGFCGNSSGSERGSVEFQVELGPITPSSGFKVTSPGFSDGQQTPVSAYVSERVPTTPVPESPNSLCVNCGKLTRQESFPAVHNEYHVYGAHSLVQVCGGKCGQNIVNQSGVSSHPSDSGGSSCSSNPTPSCSSCSTPNDEDVVIIRQSQIDGGINDHNNYSYRTENSLDSDNVRHLNAGESRIL